MGTWCLTNAAACVQPLVMPDQKTVYVTDDGDAVMLSVYVASTPADLSCGKLYAGKFTQTSAQNCAHS